MTTSTNVLHSYGFYDAENMNGYFGEPATSSGTRPTRICSCRLCGVRNSQPFHRAVSGDVALAWRGSLAIRYTLWSMRLGLGRVLIRFPEESCHCPVS